MEPSTDKKRVFQDGIGGEYHCVYSTYHQEPLEEQYWQSTVPLQEVNIDVPWNKTTAFLEGNTMVSTARQELTEKQYLQSTVPLQEVNIYVPRNKT